MINPGAANLCGGKQICIKTNIKQFNMLCKTLVDIGDNLKTTSRT